MSERSLIGWLDQPGYTPATLNVGIGCTTRSTGCDECYAPKWAIRQAHYEGRDGIVTKDPLGRPVWTGKVITFPERLDRPAKHKQPHMWFINAMMELFDVQVELDFIDAVWQMMAATPWHIYVILTKLPKRMHDIVTQMAAKYGVLPNVWLGVSIENQEQANIRIPWLQRTPAAIRAVSCEPQLGPIDLRSIPYRGDTDYLVDPLYRRYRLPGRPPTDGWGTTPFHSGMARLGGIDWVIVGGETARRDRARPMHPQWARGLRDQVAGAVRAGHSVAFFFKQWGSWGPAPWRVPVPEDLVRAYVAARAAGSTSAVDEEVAAAKKASESIAATHAYAVWAHEYKWEPVQADHKPWSTERGKLPDTHAPIRFYPGKAAGHELDGRPWQQWPSIDGRIIEAPQEELVPSG